MLLPRFLLTAVAAPLNRLFAGQLLNRGQHTFLPVSIQRGP
jgi:hypothetical protein